jgi:hypothetical protein
LLKLQNACVVPHFVLDKATEQRIIAKKVNRLRKKEGMQGYDTDEDGTTEQDLATIEENIKCQNPCTG